MLKVFMGRRISEASWNLRPAFRHVSCGGATGRCGCATERCNAGAMCLFQVECMFSCLAPILVRTRFCIDLLFRQNLVKHALSCFVSTVLCRRLLVWHGQAVSIPHTGVARMVCRGPVAWGMLPLFSDSSLKHVSVTISYFGKNPFPKPFPV